MTKKKDYIFTYIQKYSPSHEEITICCKNQRPQRQDSDAIQRDMVVSFEVLMAIRFCVTVVSITTPCKFVGGDSVSEVHATSILKAEFNNEHTSKYFCPPT